MMFNTFLACLCGLIPLGSGAAVMILAQGDGKVVINDSTMISLPLLIAICSSIAVGTAIYCKILFAIKKQNLLLVTAQKHDREMIRALASAMNALKCMRDRALICPEPESEPEPGESEL
jgi:hypothetical protein